MLSEKADLSGLPVTKVVPNGRRRNFIKTGTVGIVLAIAFAFPSMAGLGPRLPPHAADLLLSLATPTALSLPLFGFLMASQETQRVEIDGHGVRVIGYRKLNEVRSHVLEIPWKDLVLFDPGRWQFRYKGHGGSWRTVSHVDAVESMAIVATINERWTVRTGARPRTNPPLPSTNWERNPLFRNSLLTLWGMLAAGLLLFVGGMSYWVYHLDSLLAMMAWLVGVILLVLTPLAMAFLGDVPHKILLTSEGLLVDYGGKKTDPGSLRELWWDEMEKAKGFEQLGFLGRGDKTPGDLGRFMRGKEVACQKSPLMDGFVAKPGWSGGTPLGHSSVLGHPEWDTLPTDGLQGHPRFHAGGTPSLYTSSGTLPHSTHHVSRLSLP